MDYSPNKDNVYTQWAWDPSKLLELEQTIQTVTTLLQC